MSLKRPSPSSRTQDCHKMKFLRLWSSKIPLTVQNDGRLVGLLTASKVLAKRRRRSRNLPKLVKLLPNTSLNFQKPKAPPGDMVDAVVFELAKLRTQDPFKFSVSTYVGTKVPGMHWNLLNSLMFGYCRKHGLMTTKPTRFGASLSPKVLWLTLKMVNREPGTKLQVQVVSLSLFAGACLRSLEPSFLRTTAKDFGFGSMAFSLAQFTLHLTNIAPKLPVAVSLMLWSLLT